MKALLKYPSILAALALGVHAQAATIFSDNFNSENGGNWALNYAGFANWTVSGGTVDLIGVNSPYDFYPGNGLYVDLDGSTFQAGTMVSKTLSLAPGQYVLSFDLGGNARNYPPDTVDVKVDLGVASQTYTLNSGDPLAQETIAFTLSSPTTIDLSFHNLGGDNVGAILDNVSLDQVPDGGTTAMLLGMGLVTLRWIRKRDNRG